MKKKMNLIKVYIEAILYSLAIIVAMFLCLSDNLYITMFPIAFVIGALGQIIFGKKIMTTFFSGILTIFLLHMKNSQLLKENIVKTIQVIILVLIGEAFGWVVKRLYRLYFKSKRASKKIRNERVKCLGIGFVTLILGIILSGIINGNYFTYLVSKESLKNYFSEQYNSRSRFKITSCNYTFSFNPKYTFYTEDTLSNNVVGKFSVYVKDQNNVQDDYKEQIFKNVSDKLNQDVQAINSSNDMQVFVTNTELDDITICFKKSVKNVSKEEIEIYSKEIVNYLEKAETIDNFDTIEQVKIILESETNSKENVAAYLFMDGYKKMIADGQDVHVYIMKALNVEYFN